MNLSIKNRIAFISTILVALLSFTIFISIYQSLKISSFSEIDEKLEFEANKHFNELIFEKDSVYFAYPEELLEREHLEIEVYPIYIELVNTNGKLLVKSENLKNERIVNETFSTKKIIFNSQVLEEPLRQIQLNLIKNNQHYGHLGIAVSTEDTLSVLQNLKQNLIAIYPFLLFITFFASRYISKITIQPLTKIADTVEIISASNLNLRVKEINGKDELSVLSKSINSFLDRIHTSIEKEKEFTANASHQLRTPLTAIKGNLEVLLRKKRTVVEYKESIEETIDRINRLNLALDNLLMLARLDEDAKQLKKTKINVIDIFNSKIKLFKAQIKEKELRIILDEKLTSPILETNVYFLKIILENLMSNAIKYSEIKHPIKITLEEQSNFIKISISNKGGNLKEEDVNSIFEIFHRPKDTTEKGHGIGLALAKKAANLLGYQIKVKLNNQTTFVLYIPN
ncbi:sensor histidine kinase [Psychroflexus salis]|uniref:histidine kinase n=1 Tax=Psychroflexus salis TaxID=1526574 RepID=A0A916ZVM0_9FLAO|nr:HAMP domain-containing sensor histidine kinase [Psychroflexus salis]GGE15913.1 two-component sensor histidine kinase [Psychroflexus salis]